MSGAFFVYDVLMITSPLREDQSTMYQCKFCGSVLPDHASFCGQCGRTPGEVLEASTRVGGLHIPDIQEADTASTVSVTGNASPHWEYNQQSSIIQSPTSPLGQDDEEE